VPRRGVTVLDGSTFVICDQRGDLDGVAAASGFFAADTRFLAKLALNSLIHIETRVRLRGF